MTDTKVQEVQGKESELDAIERLTRLSKYSLVIAKDYILSVEAQNKKTLEIINALIESLEKSPLLRKSET